ncbi:hypothetical protein [Vibrio gazogenes]|uniref:Uncharacterized protein n=1 Tax=Vibrio gazogenes DSM 21264 = NBRC 103151 TaxID=1123492 RepID=A0A1M4Z7H5_VIBGA|nr:hypothetical protein [Vibrio gazogenes]USP12501.1 hypothetical protein MKS89_08490 [Vibrio gazogenes]SHF13981.1 hypothetical protein SAMN02745781_01504 [Vibrio gazogenes DSM 21264] [Vibrio gazogenes DSM 21264 = NBRC 103151]SJN53942.1 hypothetical protein BQ6471_00727 [Vibrio gazogenes]
MKNIILNKIETIDYHETKIKNGIAIFGSARINKGDFYYNKAFELSNKLSAAGYQIISGGGSGIMEAVIEGAADSKKNQLALTYLFHLSQIYFLIKNRYKI